VRRWRWLTKTRRFRSVPDNQEVFVSNLDETSIVFDILERVDARDSEAAEFHFDALGVDNEIDETDEEESRVFRTATLSSAEHAKLPYTPSLFPFPSFHVYLCQRFTLFVIGTFHVSHYMDTSESSKAIIELQLRLAVPQ